MGDATKVVCRTAGTPYQPSYGRKPSPDCGHVYTKSSADQPGGSYKHISGCDKASDCVLFIESTGPFDLLPVAGGAGK